MTKGRVFPLSPPGRFRRLAGHQKFGWLMIRSLTQPPDQITSSHSMLTNSIQTRIALGSKLFGILNKLAAEVAGTLLKPAWQKILAWPWPARALVLLVLLATGYISIFPESAKSAWSLASNIIRVVWAGDSKIPIDLSIAQNARGEIDRLKSSLTSYFPDKPDVSPWAAAQVALATYSETNNDTNEIISFIRNAAEPGCGCWREIPGDPGKPLNIFVSGWVLLAFAQMDAPGTNEEYQFLLNEQKQDGSWSVFPSGNHHKSASSYGTALALLGLNAQLVKKFVDSVDSSDMAQVSSAVNKGAAWLLANRASDGRWKDYPFLPEGEARTSISGVVLHALRQTVPNQLREIDIEWLDNPPPGPVSAKAEDRPFVFLKNKEGRFELDAFVYIQLPWLLIGTVDAYHDGGIVQRANALAWIENALDQKSVASADTPP
jgi:hypothetical protein